MSDQSDDAVTDVAGGPGPAPDGRPAGRKILGVLAGQSASAVVPLAESPAWACCHVLGLGPPDVITLEVRGRRSGVIRRTVMVRAVCDGHHYVVALAGESQCGCVTCAPRTGGW
jgi:hypothetical protein